MKRQEHIYFDQTKLRKGKDGTSIGSNDRLDARGGGEGEAVRWASESTSKGGVSGSASAKVVSASICVSTVGAVEGIRAGAVPDVVLDQELGLVTGIDTVVHVLVVVVIDVASTEAERGSTRVEVLPVVVVNGDGQGDVLAAVAVGMSNEHGLPVIVEVGPGYGHVGGTVGDIAQSIILTKGQFHLSRKEIMSSRNPCHGPCRWRDRNGQSKLWRRPIDYVSFPDNL